jgi:hypothetical protein
MGIRPPIPKNQDSWSRRRNAQRCAEEADMTLLKTLVR